MISELNVTTGIPFFSIICSSLLRIVSESAGMMARASIPSDSNCSSAFSCSFSSTRSPSFKIILIFCAWSCLSASRMPRFTSCINGDSASCVTIPILNPGFLLFFWTYPISSAVRHICSATSLLIRPRPLRARSTVPRDTPVLSAICWIVTAILSLLPPFYRLIILYSSQICNKRRRPYPSAVSFFIQCP